MREHGACQAAALASEWSVARTTKRDTVGRSGVDMELSARNQLKGTITAIELGAVMADITVDIGSNQTLASAITKSSVERLGLKVGDSVVVIIKATEVMIGKPTGR
jgi:molybdopterin-binding protein